MRSVVLAVGLLASASAAAAADSFNAVTTRDSFVSLIEGRKLTRFGISLDVTPKGDIEGSAFGIPVTGKWRWEKGYFCRDLKFGQKDLGPNCQQVLVRNSVVRFVSDRGTGPFADLRLR
ncbi:MAG: dihydrodipicolinate reductase [Paracoccaceae bacterium]|nr:dihydrodipicolinate reductase [Paracoccaceae bacterium]MDE3122411.1 dihydrodipicolinate reductase [Paracoccaceae bacterium]MDE3238101.1 dihydrodipicolinate reductase [Paracoccaceae bacterium]